MMLLTEAEQKKLVDQLQELIKKTVSETLQNHMVGKHIIALRCQSKSIGGTQCGQPAGHSHACGNGTLNGGMSWPNPEQEKTIANLKSRVDEIAEKDEARKTKGR